MFEELLLDNPITLMDIGAAGGLHPRFNALGSQLKCLLFEPEPDAYQELAGNPNRKVHDFALDSVPGERTLHITRKKECSSFWLPRRSWLESFPETERFTVEENVTVQTMNLDSLMEANPSVDVIKMDAQGGELAILQGGQKMLRNVLALEIEVEFNPIYQQQPLFSDVDSFLRPFGFELFDLRRYHWSRKALPTLRGNKGQLIFADALYFKSLAALESADSREDDLDRVKRFVAILLLYQRNDFALEVFERFAATKRIQLSETAYEEIIRLCRTYRMPTKLPAFRGRGRLRLTLSRVLKGDEWYSADEEL